MNPAAGSPPPLPPSRRLMTAPLGGIGCQVHIPRFWRKYDHILRKGPRRQQCRGRAGQDERDEARNALAQRARNYYAVAPQLLWEGNMKLPRRRFLHLAAGAAALPAVSRIARAQTYPTRPVRIIVGTAPGGSNDIMARLIGKWLSERLGQ